jgi:hypothetical protein
MIRHGHHDHRWRWSEIKLAPRNAHEFHASVHLWFKRNRQYGWATCPITKNGCLRLPSKPAYPFAGLTVARVRETLTRLAGVGPRNLADLRRQWVTGCKPKDLEVPAVGT